MQLESYEKQLLSGWEEVYKKGQLTLYILLALKDGPKPMAEIRAFIEDLTKGTTSADQVSIYRALRRYTQADMITPTSTIPGKNGPDRKVYALRPTGQKVLAAFCERNITNIVYQPRFKKLIRGNSNEE